MINEYWTGNAQYLKGILRYWTGKINMNAKRNRDGKNGKSQTGITDEKMKGNNVKLSKIR